MPRLSGPRHGERLCPSLERRRGGKKGKEEGREGKGDIE